MKNENNILISHWVLPEVALEGLSLLRLVLEPILKWLLERANEVEDDRTDRKEYKIKHKSYHKWWT